MGNREALLAGAKQCLYERGYARTTARDIATTAGVSLAAIGYHYGSVTALLSAALMQATEEWGDELGRALTADRDPHATPLERFETTWTRVVSLFDAHRPLWLAHFEIVAQIDHVPEVRQVLADALQEGREGLALLFQQIDSAKDPQQAWTVGSFYQALLSGVMVQWMIDPQRAPSGHDLAQALRLIVAEVGQQGALQEAPPPETTVTGS